MSKVVDFHPQFNEVLSYHFDSGNAGPHLLLLGGIHGNEICGQVALKAIVDELDSGELPLKAGKVTLIPQCNPWACASNVRYVEANLNRVVTRHEAPQNYEEHIADIICGHIEKCDAMVDIHSAHAGIGPPFIFNDYPSEENNKLARILGGTYIIGGWAEMNGDDAVIPTTQDFAHLHGKLNCLIECGEHTDPQAITVADRAARNAMIHLGLIDGEIVVPEVEKDVKITGAYVKERKGDFVHKNFRHMQPIEAGQLLAKYDDGEEVKAPESGFLILPFYEAKPTDEWFFYGQLQT